VLVGQAFVVPEGRDAHGAHRVCHKETFRGGQVPHIACQVSRGEGVAGSHGVHLRHREGRMFKDLPFNQRQASRPALFENHFFRSFARKIPHQSLIVAVPERPCLLVPREEQVHLG
jgi:hypothetical protein